MFPAIIENRSTKKNCSITAHRRHSAVGHHVQLACMSFIIVSFIIASSYQEIRNVKDQWAKSLNKMILVACQKLIVEWVAGPKNLR